MRYIVTESAKRDLRKITEYIRRDDPIAALRVASEIREGMKRIAAFPNRGHSHLAIKDPTLRAYGVFKYLIVYRPTDDFVAIVRVVHGARDFKRIFRKR